MDCPLASPNPNSAALCPAACPRHRAVTWTFQLLAAVILGQTLFFRFTGAPESKFIFSTLGVEPWGRLATGGLEAIAVVLLLHRRLAVYGAVLALGLMTGAIFSHLTRLGLIVRDDGGLLFSLAVTVWGSSLVILWLRRNELTKVVRRWNPFAAPLPHP
jgi:DoxX-like family